MQHTFHSKLCTYYQLIITYHINYSFKCSSSMYFFQMMIKDVSSERKYQQWAYVCIKLSEK